MNQKSITLAITLFVIILGSIFLGSAVGRNDQNTALIAVACLGLIVLFVVLGERMWVLIPIFGSWGGQITLLPLPFSVANLVVALSVVVWGLSLATRRQKWQYRYDGMDIFVFLIMLLIAIGFMRNPVGIAAIGGGGKIGGRPYAEIAIAFIAFLLLAGQKSTASVVKVIPKWVCVSTGVIAVLGAIAALVPAAGMLLYQFYNGFRPDMAAILDPYAEQDSVGRASYLRSFAMAAVAFVGARCMPIHLLRPNNWWMVGILMLATVLALVSGFRSAIFAVAFYFVFASWLWLRGVGLAICGFGAVIFVILMTGIQSLIPLPDQVQRSLSFMPGEWDQRIVRSGEASTDWRVEMWETVLEGDNIKNWWIGDGFGFSRSEFEYFGYLAKTNQLTPEQRAEYFMITGDLHSGPLSAAKFSGIIGGILFVILSVIIVIKYSRLWGWLGRYPELASVRQVVGFFAIMASYIPFKFLFVAGFFDKDLPLLLISAGLYKLISRTCEEEVMALEERELQAT